MKNRISALVTAIVILCVTAACSGGGNPSGTSEKGESLSGQKGLFPGTAERDTVVFNISQEPPDLVPFTATASGSGIVLRGTTAGLLELDENDAPVPAVAESWESAPNAEGTEDMVWTFHLRDDYTWSVTGEKYREVNGLPVTAHDFVYAWTRVLTPDTASQYNYMGYIFKNGEAFNRGMVGIEEVGFRALDDYTLQIELENPMPYLLSQLTFYTFKPVNQTIYETIGPDLYNKEADSFAANGPFRIAKWMHEDYLLLEKNGNFPQADQVSLPRVRLLMIADSNTAMNAFQAGELDMMSLTTEQSAMLTGMGQQVFSYNDGSTWYMQYNTEHGALGSKKVRKALAMAYDRESFVKNVIANNSTVADYFTNEAVDGANGRFADELAESGITFAYDPAAAKALLEEGLNELGMTVDDFNASGYTITTDTGDAPLRNCSFIQEQWKANLGIEVDIRQMTYQARLEATSSGNYDISLFGWSPDYNDPMTFLNLWVTGSGNNNSRWSNAEYDGLIEKARSENDPQVRERAFIECERILNEEMPCSPLYNRYTDYVVSDKVQGFFRTTFQNMNFNHVRIAG